VDDFDFRNPQYTPVFVKRAAALARIREAIAIEKGEDKPSYVLPSLRAYYRDHIADFINDWGMTYDPRNVERGLPALVPFVLFAKQREFVDWVIARWRAQENGAAAKSREEGVSWLIVGIGCALCIFNDGASVGYGSRKEEYVDKIGEPKSLFWKARTFVENLPQEFRAGYQQGRDAPHMRISYPGTKSIMSGEAGDNIGRGDRRSLEFVDEAAHLEHPESIDAALASTTNCRIDVSSVKGRDNPFAVKYHSGKIKTFTFHWRDDPRKDDLWYAKQVASLDPVVVAQEIDIDFSASVGGIIIPSAWVQAAIDADQKLGVDLSGNSWGALDVADEGPDANAFAGGKGIKLRSLEEWSGLGSDTFATVERAFFTCDAQGYRRFKYDADGMGALVRGDARVINARRNTQGIWEIEVEPFQGSAGVLDPDDEIEEDKDRTGDGKGRTNKDYYANFKAQSWWYVRSLFRNTFRAVVEGKPFDPDNIISLSSDIPLLGRLSIELSQPTYKINDAGKILVNKKPDNTKSPNLADAVMMWRARSAASAMVVTQEFANALAGLTRRRA
jgi:hypothetical protein